MNEAIEYAEMLEIPVSTVQIVRKKRGKKQKAEEKSAQKDVKEQVIQQVNERLEPQKELLVDAQAFAESVNSQGALQLDEGERIDTVRVYSAYDKPFLGDGQLRPREYPTEATDSPRPDVYFAQPSNSRRTRLALGIEFTAACALCGAIFLTNIFMPNSAINTFFRFLGDVSTPTDARTYTDFTLSPVVSDLSNVELTLLENGVLTFKDKCCVYPTVDGTVSAVTKSADGYYSVKISHSNSFTGVIDGLQHVYYAEGDTVKANVPVGFADGETEVQVTMYSFGEMLNCFALQENCLVWLTQE